MNPYEESASFLSPVYQPPLPIDKPRASDFAPSSRSTLAIKPRVFTSPLEQDPSNNSRSTGHRELFHRHHADEQPKNKKESNSKHGGKELRTEFKIAMSVMELAEMKKKKERREENHPGFVGDRGGASSNEGSGKTVGGSIEEGLLGLLGDEKIGKLLAQVGGKKGEEFGTVLSGGIALVEEKVIESRRQKAPVPSVPVVEERGRQSGSNQKMEKTIGEVVLGGAVLAGGAYIIKKREEANADRREASSTRRTDKVPIPLPIPVPPLEPYSNPRINTTQMPRPPQKAFLNTLTKREHNLIQHGAASLLLKEPLIMNIVGSFEGMVRIVQKGDVKGAREADSGALFGVPLKTLVKYEGAYSHHGINKSRGSLVKIPTFLDHIISALKQSDVSIQGILRKSPSLHVLFEIVNALNNGGDDGYTVDLASLDPLTLANLFKKFLRDLPDPVLTGKLFPLFIAASHIPNLAIRKRTMHLVICLLPKVNRDVFEVVFLLLEWISTFAHINFKVGNEMDLTNIAKVMAPTLLRPPHRDAKPTEIIPMIDAVLCLLEDQHVLHEIPLELAKILNMPDVGNEKDSRNLLKRFERIF